MGRWLDYKVTTWRRVTLNEEDNVGDIIHELETTKPDELSIIDEKHSFTTLDTEEFISVNENDGFSTIEIYEDCNLIWDNSYESSINRKTK
jgi:hypothetical protein